MIDVCTEIADIERELLALTANQVPNPSQIVTFKVTRTTATPVEIKTIVFADGINRFVQVYYDESTNYAFIFYSGGALKVQSDTAGSPYTIVSLGAFSLV